MAVVSTPGNRFKFQLASGNVDFDTDVFKLILMDNAFTFDPDTHDTLADVTASQLATTGGYTQDAEILANVAVTRTDASDKTIVSWDDVTWTGSGGGFGPTGSACIYDDTTSDDTIVGCIDFGTDFTITAGIDFPVNNITVEIA